jgi:hypothetical protein
MSQNQPISTDLEYVSSDGTNVWAANNNIVYKINVASFSFDFSFNTGYSINSISSDGINVWTSSGNYNNVSRFNIATGTTDSINLNLVTSVINSDGTYVWVGCGPYETFEYSSIVKLNAQTGQPVGSPIFINGNTIQPTGISSDGTFVWVGFGTSSVFQYQIFPDAPTADGNSVTYKKGKKGTVSLYTPKIQVIPGTPTMPSPPHSYQLLKNGRVVSTTYSFDFATHIFTFKDVDMLEPGTYEFVWYDATAKKTLYRFTIHNGNPICFGKGTDILCIHPDTGKPVYKKIETLKEGDLVKTYKRGIKRITEIIEGEFINNPNVWHNCMYKMSKRPGMTNDLWVTGGHSILIDKLKIPTNIVKKQLKILGSNIIV